MRSLVGFGRLPKLGGLSITGAVRWNLADGLNVEDCRSPIGFGRMPKVGGLTVHDESPLDFGNLPKLGGLQDR